jgi:phage I-like protein
MNPQHAVALLFSTLALQASAEVHLLPAGQFKGRDGRPGKDMVWTLSHAQGVALAALLNARHAAVDFQIDYEHQSMLAAQNGKPAPSSAWASRFEWRADRGLFAINVKWTDDARQMIEAGAYKYLSPVLVYDKKTGQVQDLLNAALVGRPNLDLNPVATERLAQLNAQSFNHQENSPMSLLAIFAALSLADTATESDAVAAINHLKTTAEANAGAVVTLNSALGIDVNADAAQAAVAINGLKIRSTTGDENTRATMQALQAQVAQLSANQHARTVDELVDTALNAGQLLPAQAEWAKSLGQADVAQLKAFIKDAPVVAANLQAKQTTAKDPAADAATLSPEEKAMCSAMGLSDAQFIAAKKSA